MNTRMQVTLEREQHRRAVTKAADLGISLAEYIRRLVAEDLDDVGETDGDISEIFGIGSSGGSDVASHKVDYLGAALEEEHVEQGRL